MKWGAVIASIGEDGVDTEMTTLPAILPLFKKSRRLICRRACLVKQVVLSLLVHIS